MVIMANVEDKELCHLPRALISPQSWLGIVDNSRCQRWCVRWTSPRRAGNLALVSPRYVT